MAFDLKMMEQLLEESRNEAMEQIQRKVEYLFVFVSFTCNIVSVTISLQYRERDSLNFLLSCLSFLIKSVPSFQKR